MSALDGAVALKDSLRPDPITVRQELGQESITFRRANDGLRELWNRLKDDPAVALKRQLWAQLLKLVYGREVETDALFFQHTFLVIVAKAIALAVLGLRDDNPRHVLSGAAFEAAGIFGAAESDFFDWVVAEADGEALVQRILAHVRRFRLDQVESDVLKILYESLIAIDPNDGHIVAVYLKLRATISRNRLKWIIVYFRTSYYWNAFIQQLGQLTNYATLRLTTQTEKDDVVTSEDRIY